MPTQFVCSNKKRNKDWEQNLQFVELQCLRTLNPPDRFRNHRLLHSQAHSMLCPYMTIFAPMKNIKNEGNRMKNKFWKVLCGLGKPKINFCTDTGNLCAEYLQRPGFSLVLWQKIQLLTILRGITFLQREMENFARIVLKSTQHTVFSGVVTLEPWHSVLKKWLVNQILSHSSDELRHPVVWFLGYLQTHNHLVTFATYDGVSDYWRPYL